LHVEKIAFGAVWIALHHHRAVDEVRQQPWRDVGVVLQQIALGELQFFPEQLAKICELNLARTEAEDDVVHVLRQRERFHCRHLRSTFNAPLRWACSKAVSASSSG